MPSLKFKGTLPKNVSVMEVGRPQKAPVTWGTFKVPGRPGVILEEKTIEPFSIPVTFLVEGQDRNEYLRNVENFVDWLDSDQVEPLVFDDDINRTYYAVAQGVTIPEEEIVIFSVVKVDFFVPDGRKYGKEKSEAFINGVANIFNRGTEATKPVIYAQAKRDVTYLDIMAMDKYLRVGKPEYFNQQRVYPQTMLLFDHMNNLTGWGTGGVETDGGANNGSFTVIDGAFAVNVWGEGSMYNGPTLKKAIPQAPVSDYKVEFHFTFPTKANTLGRTELYLLDDQGNHIGKLAMKKTKQTTGNMVEVRLGGGSNYVFPVLYEGGPNKTEWNDFNGFIRLEKRGNVYDIYIAKVSYAGLREQHFFPYSTRYVDEANQYGGNLSQVQVHTAKPGAQNPVDARIKSVQVYRLNEADPTDPSVIASAGDYIELNFPDSAIYINGEERRDLKDLFSTFFSIPRGNTSIALAPAEDYDAVAVIREVFK